MELRTLPLLVVEDNEDEIFLMRRALRKLGFDLTSDQALRNGKQVINYFDKIGMQNETKGMPQFVFLDLRMPGINGHDVLRWRSTHSTARSIPFIVLSCSDEPDDRQKALKLGADGYYVKPSSLQVFTEMLKSILEARGFLNCPEGN